jgi:hypothetical protein
MVKGTSMNNTSLEILCEENAARRRYLYQGDEGGRIMISWEYAEETAHAAHDDSKAKDSRPDSAVNNAHHEADGRKPKRGSHEHGEGVRTGAVTRHPHKKGEHSTEHHPSHQHPART